MTPIILLSGTEGSVVSVIGERCADEANQNDYECLPEQTKDGRVHTYRTVCGHRDHRDLGQLIVADIDPGESRRAVGQVQEQPAAVGCRDDAVRR